MKLIISFLPWIIFLILQRFAPELFAVLISLFAMIVLPERKRLLKGFYVSWIIFLSLLVLLLLYLIPGFEVTGVVRSLLMTGSFAAMAWITLIIGKPFTIQYAKEEVPEDKWNTPGFLKVNQVITFVWALAMTVNTISSLWHYHSDITSILTILIAIVFTKKYPGYYKKKVVGKEEVFNYENNGNKRQPER